ncbi:MAG TPA: M28 family peptidase [Bacillota bacterium]|nr:M28 family peptidase [Bacillota bacterium]
MYGFKTQLHDHDAYISLPLAAGLQVIGPITEGFYAITHSFSKSTLAGGIDLDLVDGGDRLPSDGSARGKAVLLNGLASPGGAVAARAAGAGAVIMANPGPEIHEMIVSPVWGSPSACTRGNLPEVTVISVNKDTGAALRGKLAAGPVRVRILAASDTGWRKTNILTADIGSGDDYVMFSGHLDSWYYGVMDNGGANAVMMETGRVLAQRAASLKRRLRLAFWSGHSHGRYSGSTWYVDNEFEDLDAHCVAHVNVDSSGAKNSVVDLNPLVMAEARALVAEVYAAQGFSGCSGRPMSRSHDQSFWGLGVTAVLGGVSTQAAGDDLTAGITAARGQRRTGGSAWWWHSPDDTIDKMDKDALARDSRLYVGVCDRLCSDARLPLRFEDTAHEVRDTLSGLSEFGFDLRPSLEAADAFAKAVAGKKPDDHTQMRLAHLINPVLYTQVGRFSHDPAIPVGLFPGLQAAKALKGADPDTVKFLSVDLVREQNRVVHALREAAAIL